MTSVFLKISATALAACTFKSIVGQIKRIADSVKEKADYLHTRL